ncbi:alcaligin biosynthesis protein [Shewanella algae]|uniref:lysine N(6)-hydroxylase/L-ornithine N(5)-oxygenase family protein n=1 Tax=Shewanella algae TaxID=38313 RepID=UPI001182B067|nr:SidA/IucD/PvdA family monooxygenase [Shewanella algae]TVL05171.1 alcaligin biosynthesis protein [Shewanella algae]
MQTKVYDILGIGIGPFNLSLAALAEPLDGLECLFVDAGAGFDWHPGMLLESSRLQTPVMSDLVTMADPTSRYSYLNFAKQTGRLYSFYIRESFFLPRQEYNLYCQWVCVELSNLKFNFKVTRVSFDAETDTYLVKGQDRVSGQEQSLRARHLVLGTGTQPWMPHFCPGADKRVLHSANYLHRKQALQSQNDITIVGSGQSAAEIFEDLLLDIDKFGYRLRWLTRSPRFFPLEYTKLTLEMTSPEYIDYFHALPEAQRRELIGSQKSLYKGINADLINSIYDLLYQKRLHCDFDVQLLTNTALQSVHSDGQQLLLSCRHTELEQEFELTSSALVMATGYCYRLPDFLEPLHSQLLFDQKGEPDVQRHYHIDKAGRIFVQNLGLHTHGLCSPDLGMGCYRNATILRQILGKAPYEIEQQIAFQSFGIPKQDASAPKRRHSSNQALQREAS